MENNKLLKEQRRAKITKIVGLSVVGAIVLGTGATILTCHLINEWKYKTGINKLVERDFVEAYRVFDDLHGFRDSAKKKFYAYELYNIENGFLEYETIIDEIVEEKGTAIVKFNVDGGTSIPDKVITEREDTNYIVELAAKTHYDFNDWVLTLGEYGKETDSVDLTISARYQEHYYDISYVLNGGSIFYNAPTSYTYFDSDIAIPNAIKFGYVFDGYLVNDAETPQKDYVIPLHTSGSLVLEASFTPKRIPIIFDPGPGSCDTPSGEYVYNDPADLPIPTSPEHFNFDGWYIDDIKVDPEHFNIYVEWSIAVAHYSPKEYHITYVLNGGEMLGEAPSTYGYESDDINIPFAHKDGYLFAGWTRESGDDGKINYVIPNHSSGDITLTANYISYSTPSDKSYCITGLGSGSDSIKEVVIPLEITEFDRNIVRGGFAALEVFGVEKGHSNLYIDNGFLMSKTLEDGNVLIMPAKGLYKGVKKITLPECDTIGDSAFYLFTTLEEVTATSPVKKLDYYAFRSCSNLRYIKNMTLVDIGDYALSDCDEFRSTSGFFDENKNIEHIGASAFEGDGNLGILTINDKMLRIDSNAFKDCDIKTLRFNPDPGAVIADNAFSGNSNISTVRASVTNISKVLSLIGDSKPQLRFVTFYGEGSLPDGVLSGWGYVHGLQQVWLGESKIVEVSKNAFKDTKNVGTAALVYLPPTVEKIRSGAFDNCSIPNINLEDCPNLKLIETDAFKNSGIVTLDVRNVRELVIEDNAFYRCNSLDTIHVNYALENILPNIFVECGLLKNVYVYYNDPTGDTMNISDSFFEGLSSVTNITFVNLTEREVTINFGTKCFRNCSSLEDITLDGFNVGSLSNYTFENCTSFVDSHHYFSNLETYPVGAFFGCESIEVTFEGTKHIERYAFVSCNSLGGTDNIIDLPSSIESIGIEAFAYISVDVSIYTNRTEEVIADLAYDDASPWYKWDMNFFGPRIYTAVI